MGEEAVELHGIGDDEGKQSGCTARGEEPAPGGAWGAEGKSEETKCGDQQKQAGEGWGQKTEINPP